MDRDLIFGVGSLVDWGGVDWSSFVDRGGVNGRFVFFVFRVFGLTSVLDISNISVTVSLVNECHC